MNVLRMTLAVAWIELQRLASDRGGLAILFVLPVMIAGIFGGTQIPGWQESVESEGPTISLDMAVVNQDNGPYGAEFVGALEGIEFLVLQTPDTPALADELVAERDVQAAVIVPADFSDRIDAHTQAEVQIIMDPTQAETVGLVSGVLDSVLTEISLVGEIRFGIRQVLDSAGVLTDADPAFRQSVEAQTLGVIMTQLAERRQDPAITVVSEDMEGFGPEDFLNIVIVSMLPGIAVLFTFFTVTGLTSQTYDELEQGAFRRLLAAPLPRVAIIAGKILAFTLVVCLQVLIMIVGANLAFGMPVGNSPLGLVLITVALGLVVSALGLLLIAVTRTKKQADNLGVLLAFVLGGIGGCLAMVPEPLVFRSSSFLGTLARLTPQGNVMEAYVRLMAEGKGIVDILPQLGVLLAMTVLLGALAVWRFRWQQA
jgi:ABC-2 type transport system permease protein